MADTLMTNETSNGPRDGALHGNGRRNGARNETSDDAAQRNAFEAKDHEPNEFVVVPVKFKNRQRFNKWFRDQFPGVKPPRQSDWTDRVFALGLVEIERRMPAVESAEARFEAAGGES